MLVAQWAVARPPLPDFGAELATSADSAAGFRTATRVLQPPGFKSHVRSCYSIFWAYAIRPNSINQSERIYVHDLLEALRSKS